MIIRLVYSHSDHVKMNSFGTSGKSVRVNGIRRGAKIWKFIKNMKMCHDEKMAYRNTF